MKLIKKVPTFLGLIAISFAFIQHANAFILKINGHYFNDTNISTGNRAEIQFKDANRGYGAFFLGSGMGNNVNAQLRFGTGSNSRRINCTKQLKGYYTILFTNFLMLGIDSETIQSITHLEPSITSFNGGLFYNCTEVYPNNFHVTGRGNRVYGWINRKYGSGDGENEIAIWIGPEKVNGVRQLSETSPVELVYSTSTGHTLKTLSGVFVSSLTNSGITEPRPVNGDKGYINPRIIGDIRINNADEYDEDGVFVVPFENYRRGMDITVVTSKPGISTKVVIDGQYEDKYLNTGVLSSPLQIFNGTVPGGQIPLGNGLFTGAYGFYGYKNIKYSGKYNNVEHYYRHLSGTLTLNIQSENPSENWSRTIKFRVEGEPCLTGWDNDYFITPDFWNLNREKGGPTKAQIKCAIFGYADDVYNESNGAGYETAYTKGRNGYGETSCTDLNVITTGSLPSTLSQKTIYVLTSTGVNLPTNITIPNCTAIISKANAKLILTDGGSIERKIYYGRDTTLNKLITINGNNIVLDNISIKGNAFNTNGITITNNKKNVTLNVVKVYNNNIGIYLNKATNIILNNIQSFNNNVGIQLTDSSNNSISNSQIYRNTTGVMLNRAAVGSQNNTIYNSAIYQNNEGLKVIGTNTNNNRFDNIDVYDNRKNGQEWNIYIQKGLSNIGNNIRIQSRNNIPISTTERIEGFNRIEDNLESYNPFKYTCKGGTIGTCLLRVEASQVKYYCTGAINPNYENAKKDFTADGLHQNENLRTLSIEGENYANFDTYIYNESGAGSHIHFGGDIQFSWNVDSYRFNGSNINGTLTPLSNNIILNGKTYSYEVSVTYDEMTFTGYGNEEINHHIVQGIGNSVTQVGNKLCEHDGGLSGPMTQLSPLTNPSVNISNGTSTVTNIFSNNPLPDELLCSWANCFTNPKLSSGPFVFLIPWNTYYYGKIGTTIDVTDYSYGIGQRRQSNVLLPGGVAGGKIKYNGYYGGYFIGSNVPAQSIERQKINVITKINYEIGGRTNGSYGGNKFNIISFIDRFPTGPLDTIISYIEGKWSSLPNRTRQQTRDSRINTYTGLNNGSSTILFLEPGDTTHYPVVLQTYGDRYFATHRWMTRLARDNLYVEIQPINQCLPPYIETIAMTGQWLTHENEGIAFNYEKGFPLVGANVTGVSQNQIKIDSNTNATMTDFSIIKSETGATKRNLTIPCTTGNVCYARISIRNPGIIRDILEFQSRNTIKTYQRDMKGPGIMISSTGAVECRDTTLRIKLNDSCIGTSGFMISGFFNTGWLTLETNNRNEDRYDVIIDSGTVGRTGKDANGQILHKTGIIYAKDKYDNETTGSIDIKMVDELVTITTGYTIATAFDLLNGERIEEHGRSTGIDVVELYGVTEGEYCKTQDLYLTGFKCFNYKNATQLGTENRALTGHINGHILTISPRQESDYYAYNSGVICKINIKDNEENTVTGYMVFNINTVHKPLFEEPVIIGGTKYSEYSGSEYRSYTKRNNLEYENLNTGRNNSYEDRKYLSGEYSKYTSGDIVSVSPGVSNKYTKKYHISCTGYYTGTNDPSQRKDIPSTYPHTMNFNSIDDAVNCGTGQIRLKVSIWNGEAEIYGNNINQFTTGITDYIFYDNTPANTNNTTDNSNSKKIIITSGHTVIQDYVQVKDPEHNAIDIRPTVPGYTDHSIILNTGILSLKLTGGITTLETEMFAKIKDNANSYIRSRNTTISGTILKDTDERIHEQQICLDIGTGLLRDFAKVPANQNNTCTRYRYTSENPLYIEGGKRGKNNTPEHDISILYVKIDSGVIETGLHFTLLTAKPINSIDDIECSLYSDIGWFRCTGISGDAQKIDNDRIVCTSRDTGHIIPMCNDWQLNFDGYNYHLVGAYPGDWHRRAQFSRKNTINYEIYSGEENSGYYNQHTGEWEFFGKVRIKNENMVFNDSYVVVVLFENKTPFKQGPQGSESYWYGNLVDALALGSGDNGFLFYISRPQKINEGHIKSGVVGDISYEITFSDDVASEFYEITGEAIVNKFKKTLFIKRPTFNFANPKGYLFNFPDYDGFNSD